MFTLSPYQHVYACIAENNPFCQMHGYQYMDTSNQSVCDSVLLQVLLAAREPLTRNQLQNLQLVSSVDDLQNLPGWGVLFFERDYMVCDQSIMLPLHYIYYNGADFIRWLEHR